jgi:PAS domain-containing protein
VRSVQSKLEGEFAYIQICTKRRLPSWPRSHSSHSGTWSTQGILRLTEDVFANQRGRDLHGLPKDGSAFPVEIGLNPIRTCRGLFVLSVVVDISERKRAEAAAQEYVARERWYPAAIIASSNDVIITKNLDGRISAWNPAAERLFGFTSEEAIGSGIDIIIPDNLRSEERLILERIR